MPWTRSWRVWTLWGHTNPPSSHCCRQKCLSKICRTCGPESKFIARPGGQAQTHSLLLGRGSNPEAGHQVRCCSHQSAGAARPHCGDDHRGQAMLSARASRFWALKRMADTASQPAERHIASWRHTTVTNRITHGLSIAALPTCSIFELLTYLYRNSRDLPARR